MLKRIVCILTSLILLVPCTAYGAYSSASSAIVMDADTFEILFQKNIYEERSIASTTKILTSYIACESDRLDEKVTVTDEMVNTVGTSLGLRAGNKITLYDLVVGMLLASGNDAANCVALYLGETFDGFAQIMNKTAADIGMKNSYFVTPSGLDENNHHSSAYDMALLAAKAMQNKTFAEICAMKSKDVMISGKKQIIYNHNKLLSFMDDCVGVKTGFTKKAGRCLVSAAKRDGVMLICVTLNDADDWNEHMALYNECFGYYSSAHFEDKLSLNIVGAQNNSVNAVYSADLSVLNSGNTVAEIYYFPIIYAPVNKGDELGFAVIKYKDKEISRVPILADESIEYYGEQQLS